MRSNRFKLEFLTERTRIAVLFLLFFLLSPSAYSKPVEITFWHAMDGPRGKSLQTLVDKFNTTHPDIRVLAEFQGTHAHYSNSYNDLIQALLIALQNNEPPTMAQVYENWAVQFAEADAIVPMGKFAHSPEGYDSNERQDFVPAFLKSSETMGEVWTIPFNKSLYVLYYNEDLFNEAGLKPPKTWDDFRIAARILTTRDRNKQVVRYGFADPPTVDLFNLVFYAFGGSYFKNGKAGFDGVIGQSALEFLRSMVVEELFHPDYNALNDFLAGKAAMYISTTAVLSDFQKTTPFHVGVAKVPEQVRAVPLFAGTNLAIFNQASPTQKEAAWVFTKWLLEPENVAIWSSQTGYLPVRMSAQQLPIYAAYRKRDPRIEIPLSELNEAFTDPRIGAWESIRGLVDEGVEDALAGTAGIHEALDSAATQANLLLVHDLESQRQQQPDEEGHSGQSSQ